MKPQPPGTDSSQSIHRTSRWANAGICLLITLLMLAIQYRSGAYRADLDSDPDEPAHAVSSLMVHDYLTQALGKNPKTFAQAFYAHYPKVAIGHWPPLFYAAEAVWMLVAGRSRIALLLFIALCASALACCVYFQIQRRTSVAAAMLSVAILVHPAFFPEMLMTVHPDMLLALCVWGAALFCWQWMERSGMRNGISFVLCSAAALAVHGRGAIVLLLPFAMLPLRRNVLRWRWIVAAVVVLALFLVEPYYTRQTDPLSARRATEMAVIYAQQTVQTLSFGACALMLTGMVLAWRGRAEQAFWWAMAATVGCGFLLFLLLPVVWSDRYLLSTLAAAASLAALTAHRALQRLKRWRQGAEAAVLVLATVILAWTVWGVDSKPDPGYRKLVASQIFRASPVVLIDGDGITEGGLVVEGCLADPHRQRTVLRGSKTLAYSSWTAEDFRPFYASGDEVQKFLDDNKVGLVVLQQNFERADATLLRTTLTEKSRRWQLLTMQYAPTNVTLFERSGSAQSRPQANTDPIF